MLPVPLPWPAVVFVEPPDAAETAMGVATAVAPATGLTTVQRAY